MIFAVFVALLLGTGLMRLAELGVSLRRMRARPDAVVSEPWMFPLMAVLHTGLVFLPIIEVLSLHRPAYIGIFWSCIAVLLAASGLRIWTLSTIGTSWNVRVVSPPSGGIATTGPYAWIRHPNYLVVILEIAALPMVHGAWLSAVLLTALNGFVLFHRIRTEEAVLEKNPVWVEAFESKARLIPGVL